MLGFISGKLKVLQLEMTHGQQLESPHVAGVAHQRARELLGRLLGPVCLHVGQTEIEPHRRIARVERQGLPVKPDRLVELAQPCIGHPEIGKRLEGGRGFGEALLVFLQSQLRLALRKRPVPDHTGRGFLRLSGSEHAAARSQQRRRKQQCRFHSWMTF